MGRGKFDPRHPKTLQPMITKVCVGDYVGDIYHHAKFYQIGLRVSVLRMRDFAPLGYFFLGGGFLRKATAKTRAPILTQNKSNDAVPHKELPFGGRETNI